MKLLEFQETHSGDLTGPALEEINSRHQALKLQMTAPPTTGTAPAGCCTLLVARHNCTARSISAALVAGS